MPDTLKVLLAIKEQVTRNGAAIEHMEAAVEASSATLAELAREVVENRHWRLDFTRPETGQAAMFSAGIAKNGGAVDDLRRHIDEQFAKTNAMIGDVGARVSKLEEGRRVSLAVTRTRAATIAKGSAVVGGLGAVIAWVAEHWDKIVGWLS